MIELNDIFGLGQIGVRLIEVVHDGLGRWFQPCHVRRMADARAYEFQQISQAASGSRTMSLDFKYSDGKIDIESLPAVGTVTPSTDLTIVDDNDDDLNKRMISRLTYQEEKKQSNLEKIIYNAASQFNGTEKVGEERPDVDWTTRFFRIAEDVSSEEMQVLWGQILSGEIKQPGSFSLRTLEVMKNLTQVEATTFASFAKIVFRNASGSVYFIPFMDRGTYIANNYNIHFQEITLLREAGLVTNTEITYFVEEAVLDQTVILTCGSTCIKMDRPIGTKSTQILALSLTRVGKQLYPLIEQSPASDEYIQFFATPFQVPGVVVQSGIMTASEEGNLRCDTFVDVPGNK